MKNMKIIEQLIISQPSGVNYSDEINEILAKHGIDLKVGFSFAYGSDIISFGEFHEWVIDDEKITIIIVQDENGEKFVCPIYLNNEVPSGLLFDSNGKVIIDDEVFSVQLVNSNRFNDITKNMVEESFTVDF